MKWPTLPIDWLVMHASFTAASTAAWAPHFDNNPAEMAPLGFVIGFVTGLPAYVVAEVYRRRRARR